jgi:hypothetical protein
VRSRIALLGVCGSGASRWCHGPLDYSVKFHGKRTPLTPSV